MNKLSLFFFYLFLLFACKSNSVSNNENILYSEDFRTQVQSQKSSIVFIWTSWCIPSKEILRNIVIPLSDSIKNGNYDAQIISLCGSDNQDSIVTNIRRDNLLSFYIENRGDGTGFTDRKRIKQFLTDGLDKKKMKIITKNKFGFSLPLIFLVNNDGNVINPDLDQSVKVILEELNRLKDD